MTEDKAAEIRARLNQQYGAGPTVTRLALMRQDIYWLLTEREADKAALTVAGNALNDIAGSVYRVRRAHLLDDHEAIATLAIDALAAVKATLA
jgi:uncharacterized membrane protein